jgi:hypothetical protein
LSAFRRLRIPDESKAEEAITRLDQVELIIDIRDRRIINSSYADNPKSIQPQSHGHMPMAMEQSMEPMRLQVG